MADVRQAINEVGKRRGFEQKGPRANEYADLPLPKRIEDIISIARQRVAESGGNPKHLPAMIEKVTNEFRSQDQMTRGRGGPDDNFAMPNNVENYIDEVLRMSGMMPPKNQPTQGGGNVALPDDPGAGVPSPRDPGVGGSDLPESTDVAPEARPEDMDAAAGNDGWSLGQVAASLLGVGGAAAAARYFMRRYGQGSNASPQTDAANVVGDILDQADSPDQVGAGPDEGRRSVPAVRSESLPASAVDESIDATIGDEAINDRIAGAHANQARIEGPHAQITDQSGDRARILAEAAEMPVRDAVNHLRANGIEIGDAELRILAENSNTVRGLKDRVQTRRDITDNRDSSAQRHVEQSSGRSAVRNQVKRAVRGSVK